jgi:ABC-type oligopeptide transport system ATPase subunit
MSSIIEVRHLCKSFRSGRGLGKGSISRAVDDVSFTVERGTTFGLVGESGSGKSTTARIVVRLLDADSGNVLLDGQELLGLRGRELFRVRRRVQMVFQDPFASLDPRWKVGSLVAEGIRIHKLRPRAEQPDRAAEILELCGLSADVARQYPHEFSGGQRQRIGIARALAVEPEVLVLDEPVSALDVSIQAQILNLLAELQERLSLTYVFISHDLAIVERFCDQIAVMSEGRIVERGSPQTLYNAPAHEYTRTLLSAVPVPDPRRRRQRVPREARDEVRP